MGSRLDDALFKDPLAAPLAGSKGNNLSTDFGTYSKVFELSGWPEIHKTWTAVRTKYIDDRIKEIIAAHTLNYSIYALA